jgi:hypothetical protein
VVVVVVVVMVVMVAVEEEEVAVAVDDEEEESEQLSSFVSNPCVERRASSKRSLLFIPRSVFLLQKKTRGPTGSRTGCRLVFVPPPSPPPPLPTLLGLEG